MAEIAVSLIADILASFLVEEAKTLKGVSRSEIRSINNEMETIQVFLKDADARAETNEQVKNWVRQVRQVAFRMEDVLDEFHLCLAQEPPNQPKCLGWICKTFASVKHLYSDRLINKEIQDIKANLHEISQQRERYQFSRLDPDASSSSNSSISWQYLRDEALYVEESELVGIEKHKNELISWLVEGEVKRTVFAVVGAGGLGKTTIVKKSYQSQIVQNHFECYAWITVSSSFKMEQLLVNLIKEFQKSRNEPFSLESADPTERPQLIEKLREYLREKRYVVILDDVWNVELWNSLKYALLDNSCGSRIMVTTRMDEVANSYVESSAHIFHHKPLTPEDALVLFYKKAFGSSFKGNYPTELQEVSKKIVKRCGGLPLAIVAIGGVLLMKEKTVVEWRRFYDSLSLKLEVDAHLKNIMKVISLSYHDLPCHLKPCFLYFGVFPQDYPVLPFYLIGLWIAEGFVKKQKGKTLEEVGEDYLDQLISRNLVLVNDESPNSIHYKPCKVHDLMHEFILSRSVDEDFCEILDEKSIGSSNVSSRRLSIQNIDTEDVLENICLSSRARSLVVLELDNSAISLLHKLLSSLALLKILDLQYVPLEEFPCEITKLYHLRYLSLSHTRIKMLPNTVGKLQNLETLILQDTRVVELPRAILKLKKLRHFRAYVKAKGQSSVTAIKMPDEIGCLRSLQTLSIVDVNQGTSLITNLGKLTEMRYLSVAKLRKESGSGLCASLAKMNHLESLNVSSIEDDEVLDLPFELSPPPLIKVLYLRGRLEALPNWITSLSNLLKLSLEYSKLRDEPLKVLQDLPNLMDINLRNHAYDGDELCFEAGSFQKLKLLSLSDSDNLHSLILQKDAMPNLKELVVKKCQQLKEVPIGITHLTKLRTLSFYDMPEEFMSSLVQGGKDYWKVKHVPLLNLFNGGTRFGVSTA